MALDIDSFLSKYNEEKVKKKEDTIKKEKIDLNFQKYVEDKLESIQKKSQDDNLDFLKNAYTEVKKFDEDLSKKFLGIEEKGNIVLKELGDKYSKDFLISIKSQIENIERKIITSFSLIKNKISENKFEEAILQINNVNKEIESISKHFFEKKFKLMIELKKIEIMLNKKIEEFKLNNFKEIKITLNKKVLDLNQSLKPDNTNLIEEQINSLNHFLANITIIFSSELLNEKKLISNSIINAKKYIYEEEEKDFKLKKNTIDNLIEKFHKLKIEKKLEEILIIYNEIIIEFQKMPELFFEKKVELFKEINNLYGSINNLIINNNLSTFYNTYTYGKILEGIREYFSHVNKTKKVNRENLLKIKEKLDLLPNIYDFEKKDLVENLNSLFEICDNQKNKINFNKKKENKKIESLTNKKNDEILDLNISHNLKTEFNEYMLKLKNSNKKEELKTYYNKLIFYLKLSKMDLKIKKKIIIKLNKIIVSKKISS